MLGSAVFDQAVLVQVLAVAVRAGEGEAVRYGTAEAETMEISLTNKRLFV